MEINIDNQARESQPQPIISSRVLALLALALWLSSLPFTAIVQYHDMQRITGAQLLAMGWLGLFVTYIAWFANPLFLWSFVRVLKERPGPAPIVFALLLSLDTFRVNRVLLNEGGATTQVFGYGWGVVLWFLALCTLAIAVGTQAAEGRLRGDVEDLGGNAGAWLRPFGLGLAIALVAGTIFFAISDRLYANSEELARLSGLVTKRGAVCRARQPKIAQALSNFSGPLEVKSDAPDSSVLWAFDFPTYLLDQGVPIVRLDDRDYAYAEGDRSVVASVAAAGPAQATLFMSSSTTDAGRSVTAKLIENSTGGVLFEHSWRAAGDAAFCPDFYVYAENGEEPIKTLREALGLSAAPIPPKARTADRLDHSVVGVIKGFVDGTRADDAVTGGAMTLRANNRHCPEDTGWREWATGGRVRTLEPIAFVVGNRIYHRPADRFYNALCAGSEVYLSSGYAIRDRYFLNIEKRRLADFAQSWSGTLEVSAQGLANAAQALVLDGVEEADGRLTLRLLNRASGRFTSVVSALPPQ